MTSALVSTEWLAAHLGEPDIVVLDATLPARGATPTAAQQFEARHIPGARRFDIEHISDHGTDVPHMLPPVELFAAEAGMLGIGNDDLVVTYDATGMASAASRGWWMFRIFGHDRVAVLDGGLPKWIAEGRKVDSGPAAPVPPKSFVAKFRPELVHDLEAIKHFSQLQAAGKSGTRIIDARSSGRFQGTAPEAWANGRGGHIPGSESLPYTDLIDPETKAMLPKAELQKRLAGMEKGPIVVTCGSGVTACVIALALNELGRSDIAIYDGSWAEWGSHPELPAITGP